MKQKRKCKSNKKNPKKSKGSAFLLSTILLFVVLGMVVTLSYVTVMEQKMSRKTKSSVGAFFNADSGIEWALNKIASGSGNISGVFGTSIPGSGIDCPNFGSGSPCKVYLLDADGKVITADAPLEDIKAVRSVGTQGNETTRAIEAAVAGSEPGLLSGWCTEGGPGNNNGECTPFTSSYPPKLPAFCNNATNKCSCPSGYSVVMLGEYAGYEGSSQWRFIFSCYKN